MNKCKLLLLIGILFPAFSGWAQSLPYDYPFVDPFQATVIGTPAAYQPELPTQIPTRIFRIKAFPDRKVPDIFWHEDALEFSLVRQKQAAPLIFIIAGTGANYNSSKMVGMQRAFYQAGFHVIAISSPTAMNFIVSSSSSTVPGNLEEDAKDLYRVMSLALHRAEKTIEVTGHYLTGYSLGAIQAAFVARLDEERDLFSFKKVLLINPPVGLYSSVDILDRLLEQNIPGGMDNFSAWFDEIMVTLADINSEMDLLRMHDDMLYQLYKHYPPSDEFLAALIGLSFRISSANLIFCADVLNGGGYIIPEGARLTTSTPLTDYLIVAHRIRFTEYFHEFFYPYFRKQQPELSEQELIKRLSLKAIEPYLRASAKIGLIHNEDDIIMAPGDIDWLRQVFGARAKIYPNGGHCGNIDHYTNVAHMVRFFTAKEARQ